MLRCWVSLLFLQWQQLQERYCRYCIQLFVKDVIRFFPSTDTQYSYLTLIKTQSHFIETEMFDLVNLSGSQYYLENFWRKKCKDEFMKDKLIEEVTLWMGNTFCGSSGSSRVVLISYPLLASDSILMLLLLLSSSIAIKTQLLWPCTMGWRPTALQVPFRPSAQHGLLRYTVL